MQNDLFPSYYQKITKEEFSKVNVGENRYSIISKGINYKTYIQSVLALTISESEKADIRNCVKNEIVVERLCKIGAEQLNYSSDLASLYACSLAIATIIKEFDWGMFYLSSDGLFSLAERIQSILQKSFY